MRSADNRNKIQVSTNRGFGIAAVLMVSAMILAVLVGGSYVMHGGLSGGAKLNVRSLVMPPEVGTAMSVSSLKKLQVAMEVYYSEQEGQYPPVGESCSPIASLTQYLVPQYIEKLPEGAYDVAVSNDRSHFVLRTKLDQSATTLLGNDKDGKILGCDCDDPNYCASEYEEDPARLKAMEDGTLPPPKGAIIPPQLIEDEGSSGVVCTMDAKICPDGSAVGRVPPSCAFAPCKAGKQ